jgi:hypothetical protein
VTWLFNGACGTLPMAGCQLGLVARQRAGMPAVIPLLAFPGQHLPARRSSELDQWASGRKAKMIAISNRTYAVGRR